MLFSCIAELYTLYYCLIIKPCFIGLIVDFGLRWSTNFNVAIVALPETVRLHVSNVGTVASYDDRAHTNGPV